MHVTLDHIESITPAVKTLWFKPERPVRFVAGQFIELYLPHENADDRGVRRWFTLSSSPTEQLLAITTRFEPTKGSTFKQQLATLQPGDRLHFAEPMGDFVLPKNPNIPLVFVAAGLGITPIRSMVKWLHDTREQRTITLVHAAPPREFAFAPLFRHHRMEYVPIQGQRHKLSPESILELAQNADSLIYISGPEQFVETLYKKLQQKGVPPERLVADYFPGYMQF